MFVSHCVDLSIIPKFSCVMFDTLPDKLDYLKLLIGGKEVVRVHIMHIIWSRFELFNRQINCIHLWAYGSNTSSIENLKCFYFTWSSLCLFVLHGHCCFYFSQQGTFNVWYKFRHHRNGWETYDKEHEECSCNQENWSYKIQTKYMYNALVYLV